MQTFNIEKLNTDIKRAEAELELLLKIREYISPELSDEVYAIENELSNFLGKFLKEPKITRVMELVRDNDIRTASGLVNALPKDDWAFARKLMYQIRILRYNPLSDSGMKDALSLMRSQKQLTETDELWFSRHGW